MTRPIAWVGLAATIGAALGGCAPGYIKARELEQRDQGPSACAQSCRELGMRMVAMVLVSDQLPGCVCQVLDTPAPGAPASSEQPSQSSTAGPGALEGGVAGSTTGFVVIAAAAAARQQQAAEDERRRQQQQQQQQQWQFNK